MPLGWLRVVATTEALMWICIAAAGAWFAIALVIYGLQLFVERLRPKFEQGRSR